MMRPKLLARLNLGLRILSTLAMFNAHSPNPTLAQSANSDARIDIQRSRSDAVSNTYVAPTTSVPTTSRFMKLLGGEEVVEGQPPPFTFNIIIPAFYNSNANTSSSGMGSFETNPELQINWKHHLSSIPLTLFSLLDTNFDRYAPVSSADGDKAYAILRATWDHGDDDQEYLPFFSYSPTSTFDPTFSRRDTISHDLNIGFDKAFSFNQDWTRVRAAADTSDAPWSLGIASKFQRRFRDPIPSSYALYANPSITRNVSEQWSLSFEVDTTRRWFDRSADISRRDWLLNPLLTVEFVPPKTWPSRGKQAASFVGSPKLDFQISYVRQYSNRQGASFHQWNFGPVLSTGWKF